MSERKYRAQILLEPEQHQLLAEQASRQGQSISKVVREIVGRYLFERDQAEWQRQDAFEKLRLHRAEILTRRRGQPLGIDVTALVEEVREERINELSKNRGDRGD